MFVQLQIVKIMATPKLNFIVSALLLHFIIGGKYVGVNAFSLDITAELSVYSMIKILTMANETIFEIRQYSQWSLPFAMEKTIKPKMVSASRRQ